VSPETQHTLLIAGRAILGAPFVIGGIRHCFHFPHLAQAIAGRGVPAAGFVLFLGTALQIFAGAALMLGLYPLWTGAALIVFTVAASVMLLNFWSLQGAERISAVNAWWANISIIGGLLVVAAQ